MQHLSWWKNAHQTTLSILNLWFNQKSLLALTHKPYFFINAAYAISDLNCDEKIQNALTIIVAHLSLC